MDYERKYKLALERAKKLYGQGTITESLGFIFPELRESEGALWADSHPHWISVDDELPPRNVFVLTCDRQENTNLLMLAGDGRWYDKAVGLHRNITHWMPLPSVEHLRETTKMIEKGGVL